MRKEVAISNKLKDHAYEQQNTFELKEDNASQKNCLNQLGLHSLSCIKQEYQESLIQGNVHKQCNLNEGIKY